MLANDVYCNLQRFSPREFRNNHWFLPQQRRGSQRLGQRILPQQRRTHERYSPQNYRNCQRYFNEGPTMNPGSKCCQSRWLRVCRWHCTAPLRLSRSCPLLPPPL